MDIDHTTVVLRRRWPFESVDLGLEMVRRCWRSLFVTQLLIVVPVALLANALLAFNPLWAMLAVWWLKPLFELPALFILSRAFFGQTPRPMQALLGAPWPGLGLLWRILVWRRLSPWRSLAAPIEALEGVSGRRRNQRAAVLLREHGSVAGALTMMGLVVEIALVLGFFIFLAMLLPDDSKLVAHSFDIFSSSAPQAGILVVSLLYSVALVLVMPFYVGAGFALYLNRRVDLEGWDIDLAFRRLAKRLSRTAVVVLICLAGAHAAAAPATCSASVHAATSKRLHATVQAVLATPDFGGRKTARHWRLVDIAPNKDHSFAWNFGGLLSLLAGTLIDYLLGAFGVVLAVLVIVSVWRQRRVDRDRAAAAVRAPPTTLFGLDIRPESLPPDIIIAAQAAWNDRHYQQALSLLYRGALSHLAGELALDIPKSATEGECVRRVRRLTTEGLGRDFAQLTGAWQQTAYGNHPVTVNEFAQLITAWQGHLRGTPAPASEAS